MSKSWESGDEFTLRAIKRKETKFGMIINSNKKISIRATSVL